MAHKHADLMMQYALDAAETDEPWNRWQGRKNVFYDWRDATGPITFCEDFQYRRKLSQEQIDKEAFNRWWDDSFDERFLQISDAWFAALKWERSKKEDS